jgi:hypothetical protein
VAGPVADDDLLAVAQAQDAPHMMEVVGGEHRRTDVIDKDLR